MKLATKVVILSIFYYVFSVGIAFTESNLEENDKSNLQDNIISENTELEELNTATSLSMDKEITFPRDIWVHFIIFLEKDTFYLVFLAYSSPFCWYI